MIVERRQRRTLTPAERAQCSEAARVAWCRDWRLPHAVKLAASRQAYGAQAQHFMPGECWLAPSWHESCDLAGEHDCGPGVEPAPVDNEPAAGADCWS